DGAAIPTFGEVLDLVESKAPAGFQLWVELKLAPEDAEPTSDPIALTDRAIAELKAAGLLGQTALISFYWPALYHAQQQVPGLKTGFLSAERDWMNNVQTGRPGRSPWTAPFDADDYDGSVPRMVKAAGGQVWSVYWRDLTPERLAAAKAQGLEVGVWTIRNKAEIEAVHALGVDVITTDRPDWFVD
ncbi:MAG TPA: glycerophosphodiester phosphodiesterase family protein, partial [Alphaproteobacteria bacterium]|nr:glycerophosphodiester phosphodiesterase family protein [Alphaproteobacteria bacterium]